MSAAGCPFDALVACLRGQPPVRADWMAVMALANRHLVTPTLHAALRDRGGEGVPLEALAYLRFLHERNGERNRRLRAQAGELVEALNRSGLRPMLLKGAGFLATAAEGDLGDRLMSDLDILVPAERIPAATACLARLGYRAQPDPAGSHALPSFARPQDVGTVDLHHRPPGPPAFHHAQRLEETATMVRVGAGHATLPSPTFRALHLIVHDLLLDRQVMSGDFDLRHLCDLNALARSPEGLDWHALAELMAGGGGRHALDTQMVALRRLFGADAPLPPRHRILPHLQHWRRVRQARHPGLRWLLMTLYRIFYKRPKGVLQTLRPDGADEGLFANR
ncbi:nucleotidyltransferase domain-containing protein [Azospirillum sp. sgz302134]